MDVIKKAKTSLKKKTGERYEDLSQDERKKKCQYALKRYREIFLKKRKTKTFNMIAKDIKIFLKMKKKH